MGLCDEMVKLIISMCLQMLLAKFENHYGQFVQQFQQKEY